MFWSVAALSAPVRGAPVNQPKAMRPWAGGVLVPLYLNTRLLLLGRQRVSREESREERRGGSVYNPVGFGIFRGCGTGC